MKLSLTLLALGVALVYGIIKQVAPDFPISQETVFAFILYVLVKLGVEVVEPAVRSFFVRRGYERFIQRG